MLRYFALLLICCIATVPASSSELTEDICKAQRNQRRPDRDPVMLKINCGNGESMGIVTLPKEIHVTLSANSIELHTHSNLPRDVLIVIYACIFVVIYEFASIVELFETIYKSLKSAIWYFIRSKELHPQYGIILDQKKYSSWNASHENLLLISQSRLSQHDVMPYSKEPNGTQTPLPVVFARMDEALRNIDRIRSIGNDEEHSNYSFPTASIRSDDLSSFGSSVNSSHSDLSYDSGITNSRSDVEDDLYE